MGGAELAFVQDAFATNWIAPLGPHVDAFENELAALTRAGHAAVLTSGTAAIHLGLKLLGVKSGTEVLCQTFTFSASANPIVYEGATPVFIDSEETTWNMDPALLEKAIHARRAAGATIAAAVVVHLYGMPANMATIRAICTKYQIPLLEDAAEALGSTYHGNPCGMLADVGVLSFNGNKIITTSGGGALLTNNAESATKVRYWATQARDPAPHYQHSELGYNYRLSNVLAGIGRGQLQVLPERVARRRHIFARYVEALSPLPGFTFLHEPEGSKANRWLSTVLIDPAIAGITRHQLQVSLETHNIESRPLWKPMHLQPFFERFPTYLSGVSDRLFEQGLCLPSGTLMPDSDQERVIDLIVRAVKNHSTY
jgi:dTDP-4-amino-4,6-dideoxygalactose transaminase